MKLGQGERFFPVVPSFVRYGAPLFPGDLSHSMVNTYSMLPGKWREIVSIAIQYFAINMAFLFPTLH
jgi:hypothetical protein